MNALGTSYVNKGHEPCAALYQAFKLIPQLRSQLHISIVKFHKYFLVN